MLARTVIAASHRVPTAVATPMFTRGYPGRTEGSTAASKEFGKKEKAIEDQYAKQHEAEQIKKIQKEIAEKQAELEQLKKAKEEVEKN